MMANTDWFRHVVTISLYLDNVDNMRDSVGIIIGVVRVF